MSLQPTVGMEFSVHAIFTFWCWKTFPVRNVRIQNLWNIRNQRKKVFHSLFIKSWRAYFVGLACKDVFPETLTAIYRTTEYFDWNFMGELHDHDLMRRKVTSIILWRLFPPDWVRVSIGRQRVSVSRTCGTRSPFKIDLFSHFRKLHRGLVTQFADTSNLN